MKRMMKKVFVLILACIVLLGSVTTARAENYKSTTLGLTEKMREIALDWANVFEPESDYRVGEVIPVYNANEVVASYYVSYLLDGEKHGYIVLTIQDEEIEVLEFSFDEKMDIYASLSNVIPEEEKLNTGKRLYSLTPFEYNVKDKNGYMYGRDKVKKTEESWKNAAKSYQEIIKKTDKENRFTAKNSLFTSSMIADAGDPMWDNADLSGYTVVERDSIPGCVGYSDTAIETLTQRYACAVVALTEIAAQEGILLNNSIENTFNSIWSLTETEVVRTSNGVDYGATDLYLQRSGMISYCNARGKNCASTVAWSPSYALMREQIRTNISGTLNYWYNDVVDGETVEAGHTVSVVGYCAARNGSTTKYFVIVYDGWNAAWRYFNLSDYSFTNHCYVSYDVY